jgi:hypothetical protein
MSYYANYVKKIPSTGYSTYFSLVRLVNSTLGEAIEAVIGRDEQSLPVQTEIKTNESYQLMNNLQATFEPNFLIDDTETRRKVWKVFFGDKKLPKVKSDAVDKFYGRLDAYVDWKKIDLDKSKDKIRKFLDE